MSSKFFQCSIKEELYKLVAAVDSLSDEQGKCAAHFVNIAQGLISKEKDEVYCYSYYIFVFPIKSFWLILN